MTARLLRLSDGQMPDGVAWHAMPRRAPWGIEGVGRAQLAAGYICVLGEQRQCFFLVELNCSSEGMGREREV